MSGSARDSAAAVAFPLRKAGVDCLTIRDLGQWESVSMVERYTRIFGFSDAMKFYKAPLG